MSAESTATQLVEVTTENCDNCDRKNELTESENRLIDIECDEMNKIKFPNDIKVIDGEENNKKANAEELKEVQEAKEAKEDVDESEVCSKFIEEPEVSVVRIHEKLIEKPLNVEDNRNLIEVYEDCTTSQDDSESEEDDKLRPLMVDNHSIVMRPCDHHMTLTEFTSNKIIPPIIIDGETGSPINNEPQPVMRHSETNDSFTSTDSDVSMNYDRCNSSSSHNVSSDKQYSSSDDNAKDSGCDVTQEATAVKPITITTSTSTSTENVEDGVEIKEIDTLCPSEIPDDQMSEEIVEQVEYYFSNDNILKDAFLLKHVRRNKEGFVSLKLVSSFKRVRQLTKDWRVVGHAILKKGRQIELNDIATKVRRLEALPNFDETMPSRTIVACDIPVEKLTIERVSEIFSKCGEIALVRILRPGQTIPSDVRQFVNKYPETQQKECALVEFVESQSARIALGMNVNFKIYEMVAPKKKTGKKATAPVAITKLIEHYKYLDGNCERNRGGSIINQNPNQNHSPIMNTGFVGNMMMHENDYNKYKLRRNNSADYYIRPDQQQQQHVCQQRKYSFNSNNTNMENNFNHYSPRRLSANSYQIMTGGDTMMPRKYSSCSEGYSSCSEQMSRRTSTCSSDQSRRTSSCSEYCPCSRRMSQCSDVYRRMSQCSEHNNSIAINNMNNINNDNNRNNSPINMNRKYSAGQITFERNFANNQSNMDFGRRTSIDSNYDRKLSSGSVGSINGQYENYRKYSNGFDPNRKLSNSDQYYNGRRISTDSGYDRKMSFSSDYSTSPRSRSNSFMLCAHKTGDNVLRTPIGPDGSKGFTSRSRKVGQVVSPV